MRVPDEIRFLQCSEMIQNLTTLMHDLAVSPKSKNLIY